MRAVTQSMGEASSQVHDEGGRHTVDGFLKAVFEAFITILDCRLLILETYRQCSTGSETRAEQAEQGV
jgi:hypothetical protein